MKKPATLAALVLMASCEPALAHSGPNGYPDLPPQRTFETAPGVAVTIFPGVSDPDGDQVTLSAFSVDNGKLVATAKDVLAFEPKPGWEGEEYFSLIATDEHGATNSTIYIVRADRAIKPQRLTLAASIPVAAASVGLPGSDAPAERVKVLEAKIAAAKKALGE